MSRLRIKNPHTFWGVKSMSAKVRHDRASVNGFPSQRPSNATFWCHATRKFSLASSSEIEKNHFYTHNWIALSLRAGIPVPEGSSTWQLENLMKVSAGKY